MKRLKFLVFTIMLVTIFLLNCVRKEDEATPVSPISQPKLTININYTGSVQISENKQIYIWIYKSRTPLT